MNGSASSRSLPSTPVHDDTSNSEGLHVRVKNAGERSSMGAKNHSFNDLRTFESSQKKQEKKRQQRFVFTAPCPELRPFEAALLEDTKKALYTSSGMKDLWKPDTQAVDAESGGRAHGGTQNACLPASRNMSISSCDLSLLETEDEKKKQEEKCKMYEVPKIRRNHEAKMFTFAVSGWVWVWGCRCRWILQLSADMRSNKVFFPY